MHFQHSISFLSSLLRDLSFRVDVSVREGRAMTDDDGSGPSQGKQTLQRSGGGDDLDLSLVLLAQ